MTMNRLLLPSVAIAVVWLADGAAASPPSASTARGDTAWSSPSPLHLPRHLQSSSDPSSDPAYDRIMALQNSTFAHTCFVAVVDGPQNTTYPVVWCDIHVPIGLNVTAEIKDGKCDAFTDAASSAYYRNGVASPVLIPEVTDEERRSGSFDHHYCAGVDVLHDVNRTGNAVSLLSGRFAMEINYRYGPPHEAVDEETGEMVEVEDLVSAVLTDENTRVEESNQELVVGMSVLAGAVVTLALVAIVYGKRKKSTRKKWERVSRDAEEELDAAGTREDVEMTAPPKGGERDNPSSLLWEDEDMII